MLTTALSQDGYRKVADIMRGDEVLKQNQGVEAGLQVAEVVVAVAAGYSSARTSTTWRLSAPPQ